MINKASNPTGWSFLMDELQDAHERLGNLIKELDTAPEFEEANLRIDLGHVFSNLNRAWVRRNISPLN